MATIYTYKSTDPIAEGLQGAFCCDEAIRAARTIAKESGAPVVLDDEDGVWLVQPNGDATECDREAWESDGICREPEQCDETADEAGSYADGCY